MRARKYSEMPGVKNETFLASLARSHSESAISTLAGIMTCTSSRDQDRIRAAEILMDRGWGKSVERYAVEGQDGQRLMKIVHEFVHLDPQPKIKLEGEALQIEWKDVKRTAFYMSSMLRFSKSSWLPRATKRAGPGGFGAP